MRRSSEGRDCCPGRLLNEMEKYGLPQLQELFLDVKQFLVNTIKDSLARDHYALRTEEFHD